LSLGLLLIFYRLNIVKSDLVDVWIFVNYILLIQRFKYIYGEPVLLNIIVNLWFFIESILVSHENVFAFKCIFGINLFFSLKCLAKFPLVRINLTLSWFSEAVRSCSLSGEEAHLTLGLVCVVSWVTTIEFSEEFLSVPMRDGFIMTRTSSRLTTIFEINS
jgi:hypothetical protein